MKYVENSNDEFNYEKKRFGKIPHRISFKIVFTDSLKKKMEIVNIH